MDDIIRFSTFFVCVAKDCFELGREKFQLKHYNAALEWFNIGLQKQQKEKNHLISVIDTRRDSSLRKKVVHAVYEKSKAEVLDLISDAEEIVAGIEFIKAMDIPVEELQRFPVYNFLNLLVSLLLLTCLRTRDFIFAIYCVQVATKSYKYLISGYEKLCRRNKTVIPKTHNPELKCFYSANHSSLVIMPTKTEKIFLDPLIIVYHNVIHEGEIRKLKSLAAPNVRFLK